MLQSSIQVNKYQSFVLKNASLMVKAFSVSVFFNYIGVSWMIYIYQMDLMTQNRLRLD